jgi:hypothetical protein
MLSLLHYVQAKEEDLPAFPVEQWGEPPVVEEGGEGGWKRDIAFSVSHVEFPEIMSHLATWELMNNA